MNKRRKDQINLRVSEDLKKEVKSYAEKKDVSVANLIIYLLETELKKEVS